MNRLQEAATIIVAAALRGIGKMSEFVSDVHASFFLGNGGNKPREKHLVGAFCFGVLFLNG